MLEFAHVVKHYRSGEEIVRAVDDVSLTVGRGEIVALYGPSGSGKTTLLLLAAGILAPDAGAVSFDGRSISNLSSRDLTRYQRYEIGFVLQEFDLVAGMAAIDNTGLKLIAAGASRREARARALPWLERVGLARRARHTPAKLSTGERQRVAIARALVNEPKVLLADEPTANLDTQRGAEMLEMLSSIGHERGVGVLLVTHDPQAAAFADHVHTLRDGRLHLGPPPAATTANGQQLDAVPSSPSVAP